MTGGRFPTRPADLGTPVGLGPLVSAIGEHRGQLVRHRAGLGEPLSASQVAAHAIAALATAHALAERVLDARWVDCRDALAHGAGVDRVAEAMGVTPGEVRAGLLSWCDGQERSHRETGLGLTPAEAGEVRALVGEHR